MAVCGSVCLSVREDISRTTDAIFTNFFAHIACVRGLVLLRHVYDRPHHLSPGRGFLPIENVLSVGKRDGSAQRGRSMLSTIAVFLLQCKWPGMLGLGLGLVTRDLVNIPVSGLRAPLFLLLNK